MTSDPVLGPQTSRDGMTAVTLSVQKLSPLSTLTEDSLLKLKSSHGAYCLYEELKKAEPFPFFSLQKQ